ncbi:MAG TPA: B12-binding domain-containing radical SAM protein [Acidobacteriaceae bacterium]|nr:B12-binding domain-containing radical SAM protein [Acidobacteriaceae bacterium]
MNVLLIYPQFPDTYWSFRYALSFQGKRAAQPPLGLLTVAALLPRSWNKKLIDTNVERLRDRDLAWADVAFIGGMHVQHRDLIAIARRCRERGLRTVVGGPITSSMPAGELECDHIVIGEAENLIDGLAEDLERGTARAVYQNAERPALESTPAPDLSLIRMRHYSTMTVQYSRGCPFSCEFCDIIEIYGRRPRTKPVAQVLAELDQLYAAGWRGPVFIVDDNFIGNKVQARVLLAAIREWQAAHGSAFRFITEASLNLADDPGLMQAMQDAGFASVFLGIETPDESSLAATNKLQNTRRDLLESVSRIQAYGIEVMGGFILGFDTDREDVFDRLVEFIEKSAIPVAMVGLLQAMPGTQLFRRLSREGRILDNGGGNNTDCQLNFRPRMHADRLLAGYRSVLRRIYSSESYYQRVRLYLIRCRPRDRGDFSFSNLRALFLSVLRQGVFGRSRTSYWKFLLAAATRYRRSFGAAMTMAVMGYHFQVITEQIVRGEVTSGTAPVL